MHRSLIAVALLMLAPLATAQVYKWTDASGTVHYSEAPPPQGTQYKEVHTDGTIAASAPAAATPATAIAAAADAATPPPATAAAQPVADTPENRAKLCASLATNLTALNGSAPVVLQQDGKSVALNDAERKQRAEQATAQFKEYCSGH